MLIKYGGKALNEFINQIWVDKTDIEEEKSTRRIEKRDGNGL